MKGTTVVRPGIPDTTRAVPVVWDLSDLPPSGCTRMAAPTPREPHHAPLFVQRVLVARLLLGCVGLSMALAPIAAKGLCLGASAMAVASSALLLRRTSAGWRRKAGFVAACDGVALSAIVSLGGVVEAAPILLWPVVLVAFVVGARWAGWAGAAVGAWLAVAAVLLRNQPVTLDVVLGTPVLFGSLGWLLGRFARHHEETASRAADLAQRNEAVVAGAPDAIVICDSQLRVVEQNPAAEALFGSMGGSLFPLMERPEGGALLPHAREALASEGRFGPEEVRVPTPSGPVDVSVSISALRDQAHVTRGFIAILRDVSDQRRQERQFRRLSEAATQMAAHTDPGAVVGASLEAATELTDSDAAGLVRFVGDVCEVVATRGLPEWIDGYRHPADRCITFRLASDIGPTILNGYPEHPEANAIFVSLGVESMMGVPVPLPGGEGAPTVLMVARREPGEPYREPGLQILQALAGHAAVAMQKAKALDEERALRAGAERANSIKDAFLQTVSHELRTPLTTMLGFVQTLHDHHDEVDKPTQHMILGRAAAQGERLRRLIEQLLSLPAVTGGTGPRVRATELREVVSAAVGGAGSAVSPRVDVEDVVVLADPDYLEIAIRNLIENAAKHGDPHTVAVRAARDGDVAEIAVTDRGPGVAPEDRGRLFDRFHRGAGAERIPGLGLGLAVVREHVDAMGGDVRFEPGVPKGSRFVVRLPMAPLPAAGRR
ncbi:MAG TPA: ATP-binding protein [Actinomycetota bacterium]|nr:ATP-binding protein [Actinomycetota bacterium]